MLVHICDAATDHGIKGTIVADAVIANDSQVQLDVAACCGCCNELVAPLLNGAGMQVQGSVMVDISAQC